MIERGIWTNKELIDRECNLCGNLEDEHHAVIECPRYQEFRKKVYSTIFSYKA